MKRPCISVVMPNYNTPIAYLEQAVSSILNQTYSNFEFIIVDDCSTDSSYSYLQSITDERIRLIRNNENVGVTKSLIVGFQIAQGDYIARMDSDDISFPHRFERQLAYMQQHPETIVCGTYVEEIGDSHRKICRKIPDARYYQCAVLFGNEYGLIHPTAFFSAEKLRKHNIKYNPDIQTAQDYAMWSVCCWYGEIANVEEVLLQYRVHKGQVSSAKRQLQIDCTMYTQKKQLMNLFPDITDKMVEMHYQYYVSKAISTQMRKWYKEIELANNGQHYVDSAYLSQYIQEFLIKKVLIMANQTDSIPQLLKLLAHATIPERKAVLHSCIYRWKKRYLQVFSFGQKE